MTANVTSYNAKVASLRQLLERGREQIALALPRHLTPDRIIRIALTTVQRTPDLLECDPVSVLGCVIQASQLGLDLDGILGHAYLVPFNNKKARRRECQVIVGYKGYLALARRSGEVSTFCAHVVYANDVFTFRYGTDAEVVHKPTLKDRGEPVAVYGIIAMKDGGHDFEVIPWPEILECQAKYCRRDNSGKMYGPWADHLIEMARKTAIRRLAKRCPVSVELQRAGSMDEAAEAGVPQNLGAELGLTRSDEVAARLAAFEAEGQAEAPAAEEPTAAT